MKDFDYWRLNEFLNVFQAAALIVGVTPSYLDTDNPEFLQLPFPEYDADQSAKFNHDMQAVINALQSAIIKGRLKADLQKHEYQNYNQTPIVADNWWETLIDVSDIRDWLASKGISTGFFFPAVDKTAIGYLDKGNLHYAPKLAAAVRAWEAVTSDPERLRGKTPKAALTKWLNEHAAEYGLTKDDGTPNVTGVEEAAKMANWKPEGGATKTPGE